MITEDPIVRYVAIYRDGSGFSTLPQLLDKPLPPPHSYGYLGSLPVQIPRWMVKASAGADALPLD